MDEMNVKENYKTSNFRLGSVPPWIGKAGRLPFMLKAEEAELTFMLAPEYFVLSTWLLLRSLGTRTHQPERDIRPMRG